jgi:hypothetical protein
LARPDQDDGFIDFIPIRDLRSDSEVSASFIPALSNQCRCLPGAGHPVLAGLIVLAAIACYSNSLSGPFIFDDQEAVEQLRHALRLRPNDKEIQDNLSIVLALRSGSKGRPQAVK